MTSPMKKKALTASMSQEASGGVIGLHTVVTQKETDIGKRRTRSDGQVQKQYVMLNDILNLSNN